MSLKARALAPSPIFRSERCQSPRFVDEAISECGIVDLGGARNAEASWPIVPGLSPATRFSPTTNAYLLPLVRAGIAFVDSVQQEGKASKTTARAE
jgi:hypothetical protein